MSVIMPARSEDLDAIKHHLVDQFGSYFECPNNCGLRRSQCQFIVPPPNRPFIVNEKIQTEPRFASDVARIEAAGLTPDLCIPAGVYAGIVETSGFGYTTVVRSIAGEHMFSIMGWPKGSVKVINVTNHLVSFIDWRAVRALTH